MPFRNVTRPSQLIMDVLSGKTPYEQADKSIQSAVSMEFYRSACYVLDGHDGAEKRKRLDNIPEYVKPYIEKEIKRLLRVRNNK